MLGRVHKSPKLLHVSTTIFRTFSRECFIVHVEIYAAAIRIRRTIDRIRAGNASLSVALASEATGGLVTRVDSDVGMLVSIMNNAAAIPCNLPRFRTSQSKLNVIRTKLTFRLAVAY